VRCVVLGENHVLPLSGPRFVSLVSLKYRRPSESWPDLLPGGFFIYFSNEGPFGARDDSSIDNSFDLVWSVSASALLFLQHRSQFD
jgi:hypothetical protein